MSHYNMVRKPIPIPKAMNIREAKAAFDKEWTNCRRYWLHMSRREKFWTLFQDYPVRQASDAVSAHTQVKMKDAPELRGLPKILDQNTESKNPTTLGLN